VLCQKPLIFWLEWYLKDANNLSFVPGQASSTSSGEDMKKREAALAEREKAVAEKEKTSSSGGEDLKKREAALAEREKAVAEEEKRVKNSDPHAGSQPVYNAKDAQEREAALQQKLQKLKDEEAALKKRSDELSACEKQLPQKQVAKAPAQPAIQQCSHNIYSPPRKLRRNLVGYVYEGMDSSQRPRAGVR
jgi:hypothetical protein